MKIIHIPLILAILVWVLILSKAATIVIESWYLNRKIRHHCEEIRKSLDNTIVTVKRTKETFQQFVSTHKK